MEARTSTSEREAEHETGSVEFGTPADAFLSQIDEDFARRHLILGVDRDGKSVLLTAPSTRPSIPHNCSIHLGGQWQVDVVDAERLARTIDAAYDGRTVHADSHQSEAQPDEIATIIAASERDLLNTQGKGPIVRLVDALLFEAIGHSASDVHVQPLADRTLVRERVDGALRTTRELGPGLAKPIVSRIKVMGRMDVAEHRLPQDGRTTVTIGEHGDTKRAGQRTVDLRISTLPTAYGERAVLRLLEADSAGTLGSFESLGMPDGERRAYISCVTRSSGIVLSTGPTGSGKTTTLYTTLRWIASSSAADLNVMTIEDPIEYELSSDGVAISQAQVNTKKGVTFATGLRHILRQDPDVIMVGEIRDEETARIAIQASLTGHLVLSTLHTNDAATAITRLVDLGVEPYLVSASLSASLAQRLVRRVHAPCSGEGCEACLNTGYRGRVGLFELLVVDEPMREAIGHGATAQRLRDLAKAAGTRSLHEIASEFVASGLTTETEVRRVLGEASAPALAGSSTNENGP